MKELIYHFKGKPLKDGEEEYYQSAKDWYYERYERMALSLNYYRAASIGMALLLALSLIAFVMVLPLKQTIYRLIAVNEHTGEVTTLKEAEPNTFIKNEAVTRYFIHQYVLNRHGYSYEDIKRTFNIALAMSAKPVADKYSASIVDTNPESPLNVLNKQAYREVNVLSVNPLNPNAALVRFQTITHQRNTNETKQADFQAVIKWDYQTPSKEMEDRDHNPLGFFVTYYQVAPVFANKN